MSKVKYKLKKEFKSFKTGTKFYRIARFGDGFIHDEKLKLDSSKRNKNICVTNDELNEFFIKLNHNI